MAKIETQLNITVIPAGQWGSTLGLKAAENGHNVTLFFRDQEKIDNLNKNRTHPKLEGILFPKNIAVTANLEEAVYKADVVVMAPPARRMGEMIESVGKYISRDSLVVSASKGLDLVTKQFMTEIIAKRGAIEPMRIAAISGPNYAEEVARGLFAGTDMAVHPDSSKQTRKLLVAAFGGRNFLVYVHTDQIGTQLGGAAKNSIAIADGVAAGLGVGENARAFLPEAGIDEINDLSISLGGNALTRCGRADVRVSCSPTSRNNAAGLEIGSGKSSVQHLINSGRTIEGLYSTPILYAIAQEKGIYTPILASTTRIISGEDPRKVILQGMIIERKLIQGF